MNRLREDFLTSFTETTVYLVDFTRQTALKGPFRDAFRDIFLMHFGCCFAAYSALDSALEIVPDFTRDRARVTPLSSGGAHRHGPPVASSRRRE